MAVRWTARAADRAARRQLSRHSGDWGIVTTSTIPFAVPGSCCAWQSRLASCRPRHSLRLGFSRLGYPLSSLPINWLRQLATPAHAYALLHLPLAAQSNAATTGSARLVTLRPRLCSATSLYTREALVGKTKRLCLSNKRQRRCILCGTTLVPVSRHSNCALSGAPGAAYTQNGFGAQLKGDIPSSRPYCLAPNGSSLKGGSVGTRPYRSLSYLWVGS